MMVLAVLFTALTAGATQFITDVMVIGGSKNEVEELKTTYKAQGWTLIDNDLNAGCGSGSDFIYLLYKSEANDDGLNHGYITDFYISNTKEYNDVVTYQDRTYKLVPYKGSDYFVGIKGDLNSHAGGDFIHLYYTTEPMSDQAVSSITFDYDQSNAVGNEGDSEGFDLNNGSKKATKKIYMHITKDKALTPPSVNYISYTYDDVNGLKPSEMTCNDYKFVTSDDESWSSGWYVVSGNVEISNRIKVSGTVNLILLDGCMLNAKAGIEVEEGETLNIFAQSEADDAGQLKSNLNNEVCAGIAVGYGSTVSIHGGTVYAHGGYNGAGIGGGVADPCGTVTVYGGAVYAHGGYNGAGIGGGVAGPCGTVTVYGGAVEAYGGDFAAGIGKGYGYEGTDGTVTIYGGTVEAYAGGGGAGIGGGYDGAGITVTIYGGVVETHSGSGAAGIGAGLYGKSHGTLKIGDGLKVYDVDNPSTPIATGPQENVETRTRNMFVGTIIPVSYICYSFDKINNTFTSEEKICDDYTEVTENSKEWSNGWYVVSGNVEISDRIKVQGTVNLLLLDDCTLEAKNGIEVGGNYTLNIFAQSEGAKTGRLKATGNNKPGIGGTSAVGKVIVHGGIMEAHGGIECAGIGGGFRVAGGEVTIYGGTVEAHGGQYGAGIGGGTNGSGCTVTVFGGMVEAYGGENCAGIGSGGNGNCEGYTETTIYGGTVKAYGGGTHAAGIEMSCYGQSDGRLKIGDGVKVYGGDSENPTTLIATGPLNDVGKRYRYIIAGGNIKGDANDDLRVNAADIVEMVNAKNGNASDKFVLKNADIDRNNKITQEDIDAVVKIILKK